MKITKLQKNYHRYEILSDGLKHEQPIYFTSDWHFDNQKTDEKAIKFLLDDCKNNNGLIILNGDTLCLMQGKYDPRKSKSAIKAKHNNDNYIMSVIDDLVDFLTPYADNILQINQGNHETSVSARMELDVLELLVSKLNAKCNTNVQLGAYMGYIQLAFYNNHKSSGRVCNIAYSHGHSGGVVTKGTTIVQRYASIFPDADIIISGHSHDSWLIKHQQFGLNSNKKKLENKTQWHLKTGTYKEEYLNGNGWAVEKIGVPKSIGSIKGVISYTSGKDLDYNFSFI